MPHITALYGCLLALLVVALGTRVSLARMARESELVKVRMRVHGNLIENAPMFLVGMLTAELCGGAAIPLHMIGAVFVVARLSHASGLSRSWGRSTPRFAGMATTWALLASVWIYAAFLAWGIGST